MPQGRFYKEIVKNRAWFFIFLIPVVITSVLIGPTLWGGKVFLDSAHSTVQYSILFSLKSSLNSGSWFPVWINQWASGFSLWLLPANFGLLNPLHIILTKFLDFALASHVLTFIYFLVGFYAAYFLGRALNLSKAASIIVALAYAFNGFNVWWGLLLSFSFLYFLLPFLFLTLLKAYQGERKFIYWSALFIFLAWPFALPQIFLYSLIATLAFALYLDFARRENVLSPKKWLAVRSFFYFIIPGTFLALIWLVPVYDFIQLSSRAGGLSLKAAGEGRLFPWDLIFSYIYPSFSMPRLIREHFLYIGILPFVLAIFSLVNFRKDRLVRFFSIGYIFILSALFPGSPVWKLFNLTPILNLFRVPLQLLFVGNFFLAILAGFGLDGLSENKTILNLKFFKNYVRGLKITVILGLAAALVTALIARFYRDVLQNMAYNYFVENLLQFTKRRPLEHYYTLINGYFDRFSWHVSFSNPYFLAVLFTLVAVYGLFHFYHHGKLTPLEVAAPRSSGLAPLARARLLTGLSFSNFKVIAVIITVLDLLLVWQGHYRFMPRDWLDPSPAAVFLNSRDDGLFRIYIVSEGYLELEKMGYDKYDLSNPEKDMLLRRSRMLGFGLNGVSGIQGEITMLDTRRYAKIMDIITESDDGRRIELSTADRIKAWQSSPNRNLLSMMNVKYIISSFNFGLPWKKIFETKPIEDEKIMTYVYENTEVLPRVYFANNASFAEPDEDKAWEAFLAIKNFKNTTLIECASGDCPNSGRPNFKDSLEIIESRDGYLKVKTQTKNTRYLVYSESNLPYWEARIDEKMSPISMANYVYQAVLVPPGQHLVEFKYPGPITQFKYSLKKLISLP
ncbi:MAG: hypothetical protein HYX20_02885 [Candidatus Yanofskybacteria bacterium]|nr:hypothetical protein [Candidatus Yanofskybacteria bacterium]